MVNRKTMLVSGAAVLALLGVGGGVALADAGSANPSPTNASSDSAPAAKQHQHKKGLLARTEHGEVTLRGAKHQVALVQRGQVESVNSNSITVKSSDGFTATYTVDADTKVKKDKKDAAIDQVASGDQVFVAAAKNGSTATAKRIADRGPAKR